MLQGEHVLSQMLVEAGWSAVANQPRPMPALLLLGLGARLLHIVWLQVLHVDLHRHIELKKL